MELFPWHSHFISYQLSILQDNIMASMHFIIPSNFTAAYQQSFYPRTIREWNNLPIAIMETIDIEDFTNKLSDFNLI